MLVLSVRCGPAFGLLFSSSCSLLLIRSEAIIVYIVDTAWTPEVTRCGLVTVSHEQSHRTRKGETVCWFLLAAGDKQGLSGLFTLVTGGKHT